MYTSNPFLKNIQVKLQRLSIYHRILIGNSIIIVLGAICGPLITRFLAETTEDIWLMLLFASIGILMSIFTNSIIIRSALKPIYRLRKIVTRMDEQVAKDKIGRIRGADPDIQELSASIAALFDRIERRSDQLAALSARFIHVQEEERHRIALELHDETGQSLSLLIILLERLNHKIPADLLEIKQELDAAKALATSTLQNLKTVVAGLRPTLLDDLGLIPAIRWYGRNCLEPEGITFSIEASGEMDYLNPTIKTNLYRIMQEAIHNVSRHANAKKVNIESRNNATGLKLEICDDGEGFDPEWAFTHAVQDKKLGLVGIQERVELMSGKVEIDSIPGGGTRIHVWLPIENGEHK